MEEKEIIVKEEKKEIKSFISILNKEGAIKFLENLTFPIYFLDFEAVSNSKEWMFKNNLSIDQQMSSFSILRINSLDDDETKIKHYNTIGEKEDYKKMAKKLTDFYKDKKSPIVVWAQDLELRSLAKLFRESPDGLHQKLAHMISNIIDLQQLFYTGSFLKLEPSGKSSLESIAKAFDVYKETKIKSGRTAHYILEHSVTTPKIRDNHLTSIKKRLEDYNNADVLNIKRVLVCTSELLDINKK